MENSFQSFKENGSAVKHGLPSFVYTSEEFRSVENNTIFKNKWVFVAFAHQLANVGDVQPITVGGQPVFLLRNENDEIVAFHNVCRHRCLQLVNESGNCGRLIRCPYHSWVYGMNGELKGAPFFGGKTPNLPQGFLLEENGLITVRCSTWNCLLYTSPSPRDA